MEIQPGGLPEGELIKQYYEKKAATPAILDSTLRSLEIDGHIYDIEVFSINPYPLHFIDTDTSVCIPDILDPTEYLIQTTPQNYLAFMSRYREARERTYIRMYGATLLRHGFLAGSMYDIGIPIEEITAANNTGLAIPFSSDTSETALVRYKFDMDQVDNSRFHHAWVITPTHKDIRTVLELKNKLVNISYALEKVMPEMAVRSIGGKPTTYLLKRMILGDMLKEHGLEIDENITETEEG